MDALSETPGLAGVGAQVQQAGAQGRSGGAHGRAFLAACLRCGAQLRIVDDLPASADVAHSFRGGLHESFVVVPASDPEEFAVERRLPGVASGGIAVHEGGASRDVAEGAESTRLHVAPLEQVSRIETILALASGQAEADHPVCGDCLQLVVAEVNGRVDQASVEHHAYREAHERLTKELASLGEGEPDEVERRLRADISALELEEQQLLEELSECGREEDELSQEAERLRLQEEQLLREEEELWLTVAAFQLELEESESDRAATSSAIRYATTELNRLKRTSVLNSMFHISDQGPFGTINNLRIGRLPDQLVPWDEINAAWGQACLLLDTLMRKAGNPSQYKLLPRGSYSAIQVGGDVLDLYSGDGGLARFFTDRRFDLAMSAFLSCLQEVARFLHERNPEMKLPFKIDGDKVGNFSVRVQFNQDERWTKAMKYMLSNLKMLIAFAESAAVSGRGGDVQAKGVP